MKWNADPKGLFLFHKHLLTTDYVLGFMRMKKVPNWAEILKKQFIHSTSVIEIGTLTNKNWEGTMLRSDLEMLSWCHVLC